MDKSRNKPNRLVHESSPYLLQHAYNPVDWYPWGPEALQLATERQCPILVSIGYAACHWCHVMERESFEDPETADFMNRHFVNIKIDREERPDLDHIYMDAVQVMTGSGGWPLNVFLTPDAQPFYGGTYFPPRAVSGRPSWMDVLAAVAKAFREKTADIENQARSLTDHLVRSNDFGLHPATDQPSPWLDRALPERMYRQIMQSADRRWGGFGRAPKFPQTLVIRYLFQYYFHRGEEEALNQACLSLDRMIRGGIYDQLGGGFARYSTDTEWLVPHFEKMLYDNALLLDTLCEACQLTGRAHYKRAIRETIAFANRELRHPDGAYYSALDADSEGEEGKFYVWSRAEVDECLGEKSELFCEYYDISARGNWEGKNILNIRHDPEELAARHGMTEPELQDTLAALRDVLLNKRSERVRPGLDDKSILSWNALMLAALLRASAALDDDQYRREALRGLDFILRSFRAPEGGYHHQWKAGQARHPAFLDDYAFLIQALLLAQEQTGRLDYLEEARRLLELVIDGFSDPGSGLFYFTHANQPDVILRKKEIYDGATPSGNSMMALNLYYLGIVFDRQDWVARSQQMAASLAPTVDKYPASFGLWALFIQGLAEGIPEIALVGQNFGNLLREFLLSFTPLKIFQAGTRDNEHLPLLSGKPAGTEARLYLCKNYSCQNPVTEVHALLQQLRPL